MAVRLTSWPLDFRFLSSNPGSDSPFLIGKDRYDREKLYAVKWFIDNPQNSQNRPPAKKRTHVIDENDIMFIFIFLRNYPSHHFFCGNAVLFFLHMSPIRDTVFSPRDSFLHGAASFRRYDHDIHCVSMNMSRYSSIILA